MPKSNLPLLIFIVLGGLIGMSISHRMFGGWSDVIFAVVFIFVVIVLKTLYDLWKDSK